MVKGQASRKPSPYEGLLVAVKELQGKPEEAFKMMVKAGIYSKEGKLKPAYRTAKA
jgi:hypothetical protein